MIQGESRSFGIWENFAQHEQQLRRIGATDADVAELRTAAEAVAQAATDADAPLDPALASAPVPVRGLNWTLPPATKEARSWARRAVLAVTGGREPSPGIGQVLAMLAGLWALREVAEGRADEAMRACCGRNALAGIVAGLADQLQAAGGMSAEGVQALAEDYARAMGFSVPPPLAGAARSYTEVLEAIALRLLSRTDPSRKASSPLKRSGSAGKRSGAVRRRRSSTNKSALPRSGCAPGRRP